MKLFEFQNTAVSQLLETPRALLGYDTGLGKTAIAINYAKELGVKHVTVFCPAYLKYNWLVEIEMWRGWGIEWEIQSYNYASKGLKEASTDLVICDEAHYVKNWASKRTRNIVKFCSKKRRLLFMSATPVTKSVVDLHPVISMCQPGKWGTVLEFKELYMNKIPTMWNPEGFEYRGVKESKALELEEKISTFCFRKRKDEVLQDLPSKTITDIVIENKRTFEIGEIAEDRKIVGGWKESSVMKFVEDFDRPLLVFGWHRELIKSLTASISKKGKRVASILGGDSKRQETVDKFQSGELDVLVCSIAAAGTGLTLHRSSDVVFAELPWTYAEFKQCSDRVHRIGQKNAVNIYRFILENSIDNIILSSMDNKINEATKSVGHIE